MAAHKCCHRQKLRRGLWSPEEDERLRVHIARHGLRSWSSVPSQAGLQRCGKSCRLRWLNYLRPQLKRGPFSPHEQKLIIDLHCRLGNKWAIISSHLPGRSDNEIKNFCNSVLKRKRRSVNISATQTGRGSLPVKFNLSTPFADCSILNPLKLHNPPDLQSSLGGGGSDHTIYELTQTYDHKLKDEFENFEVQNKGVDGAHPKTPAITSLQSIEFSKDWTCCLYAIQNRATILSQASTNFQPNSSNSASITSEPLTGYSEQCDGITIFQNPEEKWENPPPSTIRTISPDSNSNTSSQINMIQGLRRSSEAWWDDILKTEQEITEVSFPSCYFEL